MYLVSSGFSFKPTSSSSSSSSTQFSQEWVCRKVVVKQSIKSNQLKSISPELPPPSLYGLFSPWIQDTMKGLMVCLPGWVCLLCLRFIILLLLLIVYCRSSLTEMSVLCDVLHITKQKHYMVLDPVTQETPEPKTGLYVVAKKKVNNLSTFRAQGHSIFQSFRSYIIGLHGMHVGILSAL